MSRLGDSDGRVISNGEIEAYRNRSPLISLMDAGNALAAALNAGERSELAIEHLVGTWERAVFDAALAFDPRAGGGQA